MLNTSLIIAILSLICTTIGFFNFKYSLIDIKNKKLCYLLQIICIITFLITGSHTIYKAYLSDAGEISVNYVSSFSNSNEEIVSTLNRYTDNKNKKEPESSSLKSSSAFVSGASDEDGLFNELDEDNSSYIEWSNPIFARLIAEALNTDISRITQKDIEEIESLAVIGDYRCYINMYDYPRPIPWPDYKIFTFDGGKNRIPYGSLTEISDIKYFKNLQSLTICYNSIQDISAIANLKKLSRLDMSGNNIENIDAVGKLVNIKDLELNHNNIKHVDSLKNLKSLKELDLSSNNISNIEPIITLMQLTNLQLRDNRISDVSALSNLTNLNNLDIAENSITSISSLANLEMLEYLNIFQNNIDDVSPIGN